MGIENKTTLSKALLTRFNFANLFYRLRFNLIIFPLLMIACAVLLYNEGGTFLYVQILIAVAILTPIIVIGVNMIIVQNGLKNYPSLNKTVVTRFGENGFHIDTSENPDKQIPYTYLKECVEFKKIFIVYFKGAAPLVIEKSGFSFGDSRSFKALMKKSINKRSRAM
ncbi:MAG: YcxB family protein [Bacillota bacterium]